MFMACLRNLHKMENLITYDLSTSPALFFEPGVEAPGRFVACKSRLLRVLS